MGEEEYLKLIGENIKRIRKSNKLTIVRLGYLCDIEKSNLIPIEKGKINITMKTLIKIARALEVEPKQLLEVTNIK